MLKRALVFLASLALLVYGGPAGADDEGFKSGVFEPPRVAPDFDLAGSNGSTLSMSKFRGKVVAMAFGFTSCPRICPVTLATLSKVLERLGPLAGDVQVIFVTVDPDRDTPTRLREFLQFFHPSILGATGTEKQLDAVRQAYGIVASKTVSNSNKLGYEVHHSSSIYLIDREGKLRLLVPFGRPPETILHDVRLLLKR